MATGLGQQPACRRAMWEEHLSRQGEYVFGFTPCTSNSVPEGEFYHYPQYEPDKYSFLASCQFLLELPEHLNHLSERGCCPPPPPSPNWLLCASDGLSLPTLPGKDPVYGPTVFFSMSYICLSLFSPQELLQLQEDKNMFMMSIIFPLCILEPWSEGLCCHK